MSYFYIFLTILFTVYGQLVIKWQVAKNGVVPTEIIPKVLFLLHLFFDPWIISAFIAAFLASLTWMNAISKLQLSYAYPFMSASFVLVLILSVLFFHESLNMYKLAGIILILLGIIVSAQGAT